MHDCPNRSMSSSSRRANRHDPDRGSVGQRIGVGQVPRQGRVESRQGDVVDAHEQFPGRGRGLDLVEQLLEGRVGNHLQPQRRLAHLGDPLAKRRHVLGAEIRMVRKAGLELVDRLGGDPRRQDLMESLESIMLLASVVPRRPRPTNPAGPPRRSWRCRQASADFDKTDIR